MGVRNFLTFFRLTPRGQRENTPYSLSEPNESRKVVTTICLGSRISETAGDSDLVTMERLLEMATWEANGHVTDDVACP